MPIGTKNKSIPGCGSHHISIRVRSWNDSLRLYRDVLGMEVVAEFGSPDQPMALLDIGDGSHIEIVGTSGGDPDDYDISPPGETPANSPFLHFALATTDTRAAVEHVRQAGYEITVEPKTVDLNGMDVTFAFFKGPDGEEIEFFQN